MKFNKELIEKLGKGEVVLHNTDYPCTGSKKVSGILERAFPNCRHLTYGASEYYCLEGEGNWTVIDKDEIGNKLVYSQDDFLGAEEVKQPTPNADTHITRFPSGAVRSFSEGRLRPDYISPYALREIAKHFTGASNDFGATNYFLGITPEETKPSISRHYLDLQEAFLTGDKAKVREELSALASNCIMALHQIVLEEKGEYVKKYDKQESVEKESYLKELNSK